MQHHIRRQTNVRTSKNAPQVRRERIQRLHAERRSKGLCYRCGEPATTGSSLCARHLQAACNRRAAMKSSGKCTHCGRPVLPRRSLCLVCHEQTANRMNQLYKDRKAAGLCVTCGLVARRKGRVSCDDCGTAAAERAARRRRERLARGLCATCGKLPKLLHASVCEECFFKRVSHDTFGTVAEASYLKALFASTGGICPYSALPMVLGQTARLDHTFAVSRGGRVDDPNNVQWVHEAVNQMKWKYTDAEFLSMVEAIYNHRIKSRR